MDLTIKSKKETAMPMPIKTMAPKARQGSRDESESDLVWDTPPSPLARDEGTDAEAQPPRYRVALPWEEFAEAWSEAENRLACLEHDLAAHPLRPSWICRSDFQEAAAVASLRGSDVAMEDLVLTDAGAAPKDPTAAWFMARALLSLRRHISRAGPAKVLTVDGILELEIRLGSALTAAGTAAAPATALSARRQRVERWLSVVEDLRATPPLPAAAIAFRVWRRIAPLASYNDEIGLLLASVMLWHRGKTKGLVACPALGFQTAGLAVRNGDLDDRTTLGSWITLFCRAITASAAAGQNSLQQMTQGHAHAARLLAGHRPHSRLPRLVSLFLTYPVITNRFIKERLELTAQGAGWRIKELMHGSVIVETTGRLRNRVYRLS